MTRQILKFMLIYLVFTLVITVIVACVCGGNVPQEVSALSVIKVLQMPVSKAFIHFCSC